MSNDTTTDAPAVEPSVLAQAQAQRGANARHFVLAQDAAWVPLHDSEGQRIGKCARTIGRNDVTMISYVPEGGRIQEIPVYAVADLFAAGELS